VQAFDAVTAFFKHASNTVGAVLSAGEYQDLAFAFAKFFDQAIGFFGLRHVELVLLDMR
jgi:hypothetical protein